MQLAHLSCQLDSKPPLCTVLPRRLNGLSLEAFFACAYTYISTLLTPDSDPFHRKYED